MSDPKDVKAMTAAQAAQYVKRPVVRAAMKDGEAVKDANGAPVFETKDVPVKASEVLDFKEFADRVVVVTTDGQKFTGTK